MAGFQEELSDLAATGANSLVAAIGTDLWPTVRGVVHQVLIRRARRRPELAEALDHLAGTAVATAPDRESGQAPARADGAARSEAVRFWTEALHEIVDQDPVLRPALAALAGLTLAHPAPPGPAAAHQENTAYDSGHVYASQYGSQHIHVHEPEDLT